MRCSSAQSSSRPSRSRLTEPIAVPRLSAIGIEQEDGALRHVLGQPSLLHGVLAVRRQPLDSGNVGALQRPDRHRAGAHGLPVDVDRAGATLRDAASEFGAGQTDCIAQRPKERPSSAQRRGVSGSRSTRYCVPLTVSVIIVRALVLLATAESWHNRCSGNVGQPRPRLRAGGVQVERRFTPRGTRGLARNAAIYFVIYKGTCPAPA
jgi:hypothetical protein